jgi:eukaryotic-like serine/threonine-protein kinase
LNFSPGTRLGSYEIIAPLGSGGMGEVYRARDARLNREVAVKVLAHRLIGNPEALSRFKREAQAVAALSHPNVLSLFDYGESDGTVFAVMELLDGETLRARLASGPLPQRKAVEVAVQIARGLAAAHERGIVHRDLKPENVFLTRDGQVKVLDFGLARIAAEAPDGDATFSPTPSLPTRPGIVMGTPGYMSPEQVRGQAADPRSDIFAFGTILYEMLAGRRAFRGDTAAEAMTAALREEPPELPAGVSPSLDRIVRHCLEKNREQRFQSARDLAFALEAILDPSTSGASATPGRRRTIPAGLAWAVAAAGVTAGVLGWLGGPRATPPGGGAIRSSILLPAGLHLDDPAQNVAISPDGRLIAFTAFRSSKDTSQLWLRPLDTSEPRLLPGTEGAATPFWSPDSRFLGFFAAGKLKRVGIDGSTPPQIVCDAAHSRGGTWSQTGEILFVSDSDNGLVKVPATGGEPVQVTHLRKGETSHRFPTFLPDGRRFLYLSFPGRVGSVDTLIASLDDPRPRPLLSASSVATFVPGGYIVFTRDQTVLAQRLDPGSAHLLGEPQPIAEMPQVRESRRGGSFVTGASTGLLVFGSASPWTSRLQWFDRTGMPGSNIPLPAGYQWLNLSPDARYTALELITSINDGDLWLMELASGIITRLTHEPGLERWPVWSSDSRRIAYAAYPSGLAPQLCVRELANPERKEILFKSAANLGLRSWSRDGRFLFFDQQTARPARDIWFLPLEGRRPVPYLQTQFNEFFPILSPDGRLLAYFSDESGTDEIYVQSFPEPGKKVRVSTSATSEVSWSADGRQLFYTEGDSDAVVVDIQTVPELRASRPRLLFHFPPRTVSWVRTADGRFLVQIKDAETAPASITVIANWTALLESPDQR